jgi:tellurite resistance protein
VKHAPSAVKAEGTVRLAPNLFGVAFGICGLAQCWAAGHAGANVPAWPADALWIAAAVTWVVTVVGYLVNATRLGRLREDFTDATFAPFLALGFIVPMLLGARLAAEARTAGVAIFTIALITTILFGGWISGQWIISDITLAQWHPGYLLPTVGGGLLAAAASATVGYRSLAGLMFGYGVICWFALGSIVLVRLFTQPALAAALVPTMAIELAPPVVAGSAWFTINGGRVDAVALGVSGYGMLMALVQVRLVPLYAKTPFAPSWWAFSFSYAAAFALGIRWLAAEATPHRDFWTDVLLAIVTLALAALAARTAVGVSRGTFFPRVAERPAVNRIG